MGTPIARYAFSVDEWHRMGEVGIFDEDSRVELLDGEVFTMAPIGNRHLACVNRITRLFVVAVGEQAIVSVQNPIRLDDHSETQPDVALLHPRADNGARLPPGAEDVLVVVEVADSSLAWDRDVKAPRYGAAGVPRCWVVDLTGGEILVLSAPGPSGYHDLHRAQRGETLEVAGLPGVAIVVDEVLGAA